MLKILQALAEIFFLLKELLALYSQAKKEKWIEEGKGLSKEIKEAKTDEQRAELARRLFNRSSSMP